MVRKMIFSICWLILGGCGRVPNAPAMEWFLPTPTSITGIESAAPADLHISKEVKATIIPDNTIAASTMMPYRESRPTQILQEPPQLFPAATTLLERVRADLANRLGIPIADISLVKITSDEVPAGNLGCPGEGTPPAAMEAIIVVKVILLRAHEQEYFYHARGLDYAFCGQVIRPGE